MKAEKQPKLSKKSKSLILLNRVIRNRVITIIKFYVTTQGKNSIAHYHFIWITLYILTFLRHKSVKVFHFLLSDMGDPNILDT